MVPWRLHSVFRPLPFLNTLAVLLAVSGAAAQKAPATPPKDGIRGTLVRVANLYIEPDETSARLAVVTPGREMVLAEHNGQWVRVFANTDAPDTRKADQPVLEQDQQVTPISGWVLDKGIVDTNTPHGDEVLFGEAAGAELAATDPHPPPRAAQDARLLYRRLVELFPQSPRAGEAMWRSADIRWEIEKADASTLPSAHEKEAYLREQMDEDELRKVEKYFPHTKWADLAAYDLIDNKLCGDWQGSEKCPEQEADFYQRYADEHPASPKAAEALYKAAWRMAAAADMWTADGERKRGDEDRGRAQAIAQHLEQKYPESDYAPRCFSLMYKVQQGIPVYGSERE